MTRALLLFACLTLLIGYALGVLVGSMGPACPQEDSCRADYRGGAWHIEEVPPHMQ